MPAVSASERRGGKRGQRNFRTVPPDVFTASRYPKPRARRPVLRTISANEANKPKPDTELRPNASIGDQETQLTQPVEVWTRDIDAASSKETDELGTPPVAEASEKPMSEFLRHLREVSANPLPPSPYIGNPTGPANTWRPEYRPTKNW